jgi:GntR family transcriptional regulator, rspAB operon transcriptional repressor
MDARVTTKTLDPGRAAAPQVFDSLREGILSLELAPGTVLSRVDLQQRFGVSSTPVRDALMRLQEEGLVEVFPQAATRVSLIDVPLARQAQFLRRALEQEAVRLLAAAPGPDLLARLRELITLQRASARRGDLERFNAADLDFHRLIYEAAGVPDLWLLVRRRSGHIERIRRLHLPIKGKAAQIVRDHRAVVDALEARRPARAAAALRDHLSRSLAYSDELRLRFPSYFRP